MPATGRHIRHLPGAYPPPKRTLPSIPFQRQGEFFKAFQKRREGPKMSNRNKKKILTRRSTNTRRPARTKTSSKPDSPNSSQMVRLSSLIVMTRTRDHKQSFPTVSIVPPTLHSPHDLTAQIILCHPLRSRWVKDLARSKQPSEPFYGGARAIATFKWCSNVEYVSEAGVSKGYDMSA